MRDLNRQKFEENWKQAFDGAEVEPSASVWSNVELDLVHVESQSMKRKVVFYKWLAAASVLLVVFLGGTFFYTTKIEDQQIAAINTKSPKDKTDDLKRENDVTDSDKNKMAVESAESTSQNGIANRPKSNSSGEIKTNSIKTTVVIDRTNKENGGSEQKQVIASNTIPSKVKYQEVSLLSLIKETPVTVGGEIVLPRLVLPAMPAAFMASSKKNNSSEDLWASVGFSAGNYNPGRGGSAGGNASFANADATKAAYLNNAGYSDASNVGSAYSAGFAVSKKVFSRWVVQSGINYMNQTVGYTSNYLAYTASNQSKAFVVEYADFASQSVTITSPYQINSAVEVVSLPLQTGYLLIDRKIGWQLNTGVAADFFVRNTLTDQSGNASRFSQSTGDNSPYRAVSWAGLLGTELSYKVAKQYRISLVPSMRYSVNSVLKSTSGQTSNPLVMDIGFRFRYIFK